MIGSIVLLLVQHFFYDGVMPWNIWFKYISIAVIETIVYFYLLKKLGKRDLETNYGRNKND
jgi:hypothetical protein